MQNTNKPKRTPYGNKRRRIISGPTASDLEAKTLIELQEMAKEAGITKVTNIRKANLITTILE
ncbi:MAG: Rho termination factor N-terminal domain-containing protein, partial [Candidatus Sabulitectum sp.]|nr:Rho termination factor N-terminal domain-containing protein [Candidatus Sabulitectum sp.]